MEDKMPGFTHFDEKGQAIMVDVTEKDVTVREAEACGKIIVTEEIYDAIEAGAVKKGDVLGVARVAGIMGAKKTAELIPMCHILPLTGCRVDFVKIPEELSIEARCTVKVTGRTGVEMEALTGVTTALLTIYDMCKAIDKGMIITDVHLVRKTGGKSGDVEFAG